MAQATVSRTTPLKTIVGIFPSDRKAVDAMRSLDAAGFNADRVQLTADDPSRAAEAGGKTFALEGGIAGLIAGVIVAAGFTVWGNLATNPVGLVIGAIGVIGGLTAIGFVIGRTLGRHSPDAHLFARVVQSGGAIVSVQCADEECDLAAQVLDGAGARDVRDEAGPEAV
ncbi:MAG TPA: hypothetical protein VGT60_03310 [Candidatus Limnocylindria bacterium]|nr:hypothetical protein [Candidatus Limnocylindria bacterium]